MEILSTIRKIRMFNQLFISLMLVTVTLSGSLSWAQSRSQMREILATTDHPQFSDFYCPTDQDSGRNAHILAGAGVGAAVCMFPGVILACLPALAVAGIIGSISDAEKEAVMEDSKPACQNAPSSLTPVQQRRWSEICTTIATVTNIQIKHSDSNLSTQLQYPVQQSDPILRWKKDGEDFKNVVILSEAQDIIRLSGFRSCLSEPAVTEEIIRRDLTLAEATHVIWAQVKEDGIPFSPRYERDKRESGLRIYQASKTYLKYWNQGVINEDFRIGTTQLPDDASKALQLLRTEYSEVASIEDLRHARLTVRDVLRLAQYVVSSAEIIKFDSQWIQKVEKFIAAVEAGQPLSPELLIVERKLNELITMGEAALYIQNSTSTLKYAKHYVLGFWKERGLQWQ